MTKNRRAFLKFRTPQYVLNLSIYLYKQYVLEHLISQELPKSRNLADLISQELPKSRNLAPILLTIKILLCSIYLLYYLWSYYWAQKKFQQEKIKIEGVAFISKKYLKSHFRDPKKAFFSISYFKKCFFMQSLPTANCSLV